MKDTCSDERDQAEEKVRDEAKVFVELKPLLAKHY
jgi:hypothetical protein